MKITPPDSFIQICRMFHQDVDKDHQTLDALAAYGVRGISGTDRIAVAAFLDDLLGGDLTPAEIKAVWDRGPADVYFRSPKHLVELLRLMREKIDS